MTDAIQDLLPQIQDILARSDLSTISAKAVRKELAVRNPGLDIKTHKAEIDTLTSLAFSAFTENSPSQQEQEDVKPSTSSSKPKPKPKRPRSISPPATSSPAQPIRNGIGAGAKKVKTAAETDEEVAQRLHAELNGIRTTRGAASGANTKKKAQWGKKKKKEEDGEPKARKVSNTGFNKPHRLSEALSAVVGTDVLSRPQVTKQLWVYIKAHDLQDPNKKTDIIPDAKLRKVLPFERISSFAMAKAIGSHLFPFEGEHPNDLVDDDE